MKTLSKLLVLLLFAAGAAGVFLYPWLCAPEVRNAFEAAALLEQAVRSGEGSITFREEQIDPNRVYAALEARLPYAFSLRATTRPNHTTEIGIEISRPARQEQARTYAEAIAAESITPDMTDEQKLRALHDALIRLCVYDVDTAALTTPDGATAPFAADGALIDHKAVCAGYGRAYVMLCEAAGLRAIYISSEEMNHGWNAVRLDGETYFIDCTFDDPVPDRGEYVHDRYFLRTAEELAESHQWDRAFYEQALDSLDRLEKEN